LPNSRANLSAPDLWVMTSVETLGYYRPSLRDEEGQILAALDILVRQAARPCLVDSSISDPIPPARELRDTAIDKVAMECGGKRSATPLSLTAVTR
jgi:hypothetical protein